MSLNYSQYRLPLLDIGEGLKYPDVLIPAKSEEDWQLVKQVFTLANGSVSGEGIPPEILRLTAEIAKRDALRARELEEEFAEISREVQRYWQAASEAAHELHENQRLAIDHNEKIYHSIKGLTEDLANTLIPLVERLAELRVECDKEHLAWAEANGKLRAMSEVQPGSEDAMAHQLGKSLPPEPTRKHKAALIAAEAIGGAGVGGQYALASGKVEIESLASGDVTQLCIFVACICLGVAAMLCMSYAVASRFAEARAERDHQPRSKYWWGNVLIGSLAIACFASVETVIVRMGLVNANQANLITGNMSVGDITALSWVLGVLISLSILIAAATFGWTRLYGEILRRQVVEASAARVEGLASPEHVFEAKTDAYVAEERSKALDVQAAAINAAIEAAQSRTNAVIELEKGKLKPVPEAIPPERCEALRRQLICIAVKLDEAVRRRRAVVDALSSIPVERELRRNKVRPMNRQLGLWQRFIALFARKPDG